MPTFALTLHARYRRRRSGECCGLWAVPPFRKSDLLLLHGLGSHVFAREVRALEGAAAR